jgi:transposase InsO family protein
MFWTDSEREPQPPFRVVLFLTDPVRQNEEHVTFAFGEQVWTAEYRSLEEARDSIARWIEEYNHDRPHRGVGNRTPREAFLAFTGVLNSEALAVQI